MNFTDLFVRRPVLASVVSLMILLLGLRSVMSLDLRQWPKLKSTVVTVTTTYAGASGELIKGFITTPLQQAIAESDGIDFMTSTSTQGKSTIEVNMVLNYDPNAAVSEIQAKVASRRNVLPESADDPVITSTTGDRTALMYLAFFSDSLSPSHISDYLLRVVQPKLQALPGVAKAELLGNKTFAMRIWLDPQRMAAFGVTAEDVQRVLLANNYLAGVGQIKSNYVKLDLSATTDVSNPDQFRKLVIHTAGDSFVRLEDVADVELGSEDYESENWYKGKTAIFIGIQPTPGANPLTVANEVHKLLPDVRSQLPGDMQVELPYDASEYINQSIKEVFRTLAEAVLIVLLIIFVSLGSARAALIPAVAVPLSLIGAAFFMLLMGFSINLLTLLAMVLAIGLVVDDAIVVVENIHRHIEHGESRFRAALLGARELGLPIIAMTTTLVAVYAPIGFMSGLVGSLFKEFAFSLAGAVIISGAVALTLSPMLSSKVLKASGQTGRFERAVERFFVRLSSLYQGLLHRSLDYLPVTVVFAGLVLTSIYFMYATSQHELAPTEDQSIIFFQASSPQTATLDYDMRYMRRVEQMFESIPEHRENFLIIGAGGDPTNSFGGFKMAPPDQRERSQMALMPELQAKLSEIAGLQMAVFPRPSIPGPRGGLPVQFVITSPADYTELDRVAGQMIGQAMQSGQFLFLRKSIDITRPMTTIEIDRDRAANLGISMEEIGRNLAVMLGGNLINWFNLDERSYKVIPQVEQRFRLASEMLDDYYVNTASGDLIPLSTLVHFKSSVEPSSRTQFQQLNSITVEGIPTPGRSLGDALAYLKQLADTSFPAGFTYDYTGESRQYVQQGSALMATFFLAILVIYLVLAAQFESWRDPIIILVSVPMSIAGAMAFITLGFASINIYTQVGLITLIGLIAKNGILIVQFANQLQATEGLGKREAVERAASIRLRPILMTTGAMIVAMIPLLTATGPGAVSRFDIGLVIASGLGIGTLFTLFVVPAVYMLLARTHRPEEQAEAAAPGSHAVPQGK
jgi:multidrug efflux pump